MAVNVLMANPLNQQLGPRFGGHNPGMCPAPFPNNRPLICPQAIGNPPGLPPQQISPFLPRLQQVHNMPLQRVPLQERLQHLKEIARLRQQLRQLRPLNNARPACPIGGGVHRLPPRFQPAHHPKKKPIAVRQPQHRPAAKKNYAIYQFGAPKAGSAGGYQADNVMARTLMRNPSKQVRGNLEIVHQRLKHQFNGMSNEALTWLLDANQNMSRGGFRTPQELRAFLQTPANKIPASRLLTGIATIAAAMGYRAAKLTFAKNPVPITFEQKKMAALIDKIVGREKVDPINKAYKERAEDDIKPEAINGRKINPKNVMMIRANMVSHASHVVGDAKRQMQPLPNRFFRKYINGSKPSWLKRALNQGIKVRAHTSGSAPLACSAIKGLLRNSTGSYQVSGQDAIDLYTTLFLPHFHRSDFHSLAETQAGIDYFVQEQKHQKYGGPRPVAEGPATALRRAIKAMIGCASNEVPAGKKVSPRQAMLEFQKELLV